MVSDYNALALLCQYRQPYIKIIVCYNFCLYQKKLHIFTVHTQFICVRNRKYVQFLSITLLLPVILQALDHIRPLHLPSKQQQGNNIACNQQDCKYYEAMRLVNRLDICIVGADTRLKIHPAQCHTANCTQHKSNRNQNVIYMEHHLVYLFVLIAKYLQHRDGRCILVDQHIHHQIDADHNDHASKYEADIDKLFHTDRNLIDLIGQCLFGQTGQIFGFFEIQLFV